MIDLHTHLLPGVDDGARDLDRSRAVFAAFAAAGVRTVVCTPHLRASALRGGAPARHAERLAALRAAAPDGLTVLHGWEILLDDPVADLSAPALRLGDAPAVLVELPRGPALPPHVDHVFARVRASGLTPVLAHPERYAGLRLADAVAWRSAGVALQGTADRLAARGRSGAWARRLLAAGQLDLLASDNHGDDRSLAAARDLLVRRGASEAVELLTEENPARLLRGEPLVPVPPVRLPGAPLRASVGEALAAVMRLARPARPARPARLR